MYVYSYVYIHIYIHTTQVTHINESRHTYHCHTYQWAMSRISMSHVPHFNESCHTCAQVSEYAVQLYVLSLDDSSHTYLWVTSHISMSHISIDWSWKPDWLIHKSALCTRIALSPQWGPNEGRHTYQCHTYQLHTYQWVMSCISMRHVPHINESCHICAQVSQCGVQLYLLYHHEVDMWLCRQRQDSMGGGGGGRGEIVTILHANYLSVLHLILWGGLK